MNGPTYLFPGGFAITLYLYETSSAGASWVALGSALVNKGIPFQLASNGSGALLVATTTSSGDELIGATDGGSTWSTVLLDDAIGSG